MKKKAKEEMIKKERRSHRKPFPVEWDSFTSVGKPAHKMIPAVLSRPPTE